VLALLKEGAVHLLEVVFERLEELGVDLVLGGVVVLEALEDELELLVVDVVVLPPGRAVLLQVLAET